MRRRVKKGESQRFREGTLAFSLTSLLYSQGNKNNRKRGVKRQGEIEALSSLLGLLFPQERGRIEEAKGKARDSEAFLRRLARESLIMRPFILKHLKDEPLIAGGGEDGRC
jgi:hypothetical protein